MQANDQAATMTTPPPRGAAVDVAAFGAVGDGKMDCTAAVTAAIKYIHSQVGPKGAVSGPSAPSLLFGAGAFVLSAPLVADTFVIEGVSPSNTQLLFHNTQSSPSSGVAEGGWAVVLGTSWNTMRTMNRRYCGVRNLSIVGGTNDASGAHPNSNTANGLLLHSLFQGEADVQNVHVSYFCSPGAVGIGLCNVQDIVFHSLKAEKCGTGLQLSAATKTEPGDRGNHNTNLTFVNYVGQSCDSWSIACGLPGHSGADNITFIGGVSQSGSGMLASLASIGTIGFYGHYFEVASTQHHELVISDVTQAVLSNCHFTSIGSQVTASGKTCLEVNCCSFPSKYCQAPKSLPNGAR